jgi:hypothetical protein
MPPFGGQNDSLSHADPVDRMEDLFRQCRADLLLRIEIRRPQPNGYGGVPMWPVVLVTSLKTKPCSRMVLIAVQNVFWC